MTCRNKFCQYNCVSQCTQAWSVSLNEIGVCEQFSPITNTVNSTSKPDNISINDILEKYSTKKGDFEYE